MHNRSIALSVCMAEFVRAKIRETVARTDAKQLKLIFGRKRMAESLLLWVVSVNEFVNERVAVHCWRCHDVELFPMAFYGFDRVAVVFHWPA